ncbi:MAG: bifunctional adenosylcobinamide kinase/adenosylcobinamide-phosphate guanylyltransferase [Methylococcales bacterium]|nr:bifunctional adenosylcobinamide kinase/adenosylcobinamide-phosphate guanylyltransferase [Methylococcales bacterium]MDD5754581.1 bifunctional adenosylcobinamide kinase/adenosylcobinamide-phosphate guanylyltransferase [Methylococcales bacterium]
MKTLFIGGVKSGKSRLAETAILEFSKGVKPYYLATNECFDDEMKARVLTHKQQRQNAFDTIEEPVKLFETLQLYERPVLIECVTMWLNNMLYHQFSEQAILDELEAVMTLPIDLVLVHNEVGFGVIPENKLARQFVDLSGKAAQLMARHCEQAYFCSAGLALKMK